MKTYKVIPLADRLTYFGRVIRFDGVFADDHGYSNRDIMRECLGVSMMRKMEKLYFAAMYNNDCREFKTLKAAKKHALKTGQKVAYIRNNSVHYI